MNPQQQRAYARAQAKEATAKHHLKRAAEPASRIKLLHARLSRRLSLIFARRGEGVEAKGRRFVVFYRFEQWQAKYRTGTGLGQLSEWSEMIPLGPKGAYRATEAQKLLWLEKAFDFRDGDVQQSASKKFLKRAA